MSSVRVKLVEQGARKSKVVDARTLGELRESASELCSFRNLTLVCGFPPRELVGADDSLLQECGVTSGTLVKVREASSDLASAVQKGDAAPAAAAAAAASASRGEKWSCVACTFLNEPLMSACSICGTARAGGGGGGGSAAAPPAAAAAAAVRKMVRRVVDADNSCLFTSIGYLVFHSDATLRRNAGTLSDMLRGAVAETVRRNAGGKWSSAVLGKERNDYITWILSKKSWGGYIELCILSEHLGVDIVAIDVSSLSVTETGKSGRAIFLIYDGIHYDALARGVEGDESRDQTVFEGSNERDGALAEALALAKAAKEARKFTDTSNYTLRCLVCQVALKGKQGGSGACDRDRAPKFWRVLVLATVNTSNAAVCRKLLVGGAAGARLVASERPARKNTGQERIALVRAPASVPLDALLLRVVSDLAARVRMEEEGILADFPVRAELEEKRAELVKEPGHPEFPGDQEGIVWIAQHRFRICERPALLHGINLKNARFLVIVGRSACNDAIRISALVVVDVGQRPRNVYGVVRRAALDFLR